MNRFALPLLAAFVVPFPGALPASAQSGSPPPFNLDSLLSTPVSTAAKYDQRQTDAPAFVTIVTAADIRRYGYRTLEEVLAGQAGFTTGTDREYSDVGFRGFGRPGSYNNKVLLLVDGHALNENYTGGTRIGSDLGVDLDGIQRIEIVRGPGSSLYGARAMLAVLNLVTKTGRDLDGLDVIGTLGEHGTRGASARYGAVFGATSDLALSASWGETDGEDIYFREYDFPTQNHGLAEGLDWERFARGQVSFRRGGLTLSAGGSVRSKGIPTASYQSAFNNPFAEIRDGMGFADVNYGLSISPAAQLTLRAHGDLYDNNGFFPFGSPTPDGPGAPSASTDIDVHSFGGEVRLRWDASATHRIVVGLEGLQAFRASHTIQTTTATTFQGDFPYSIGSAFLHDELQVTPDLSVTLGVRRDQYSTSGSSTTPRGAVVYHFSPRTTLKALAGEAFRAPNILEMYVSQSSAALIANPNLKPEKIRTLELVWDQRFESVATTLSLFHNKVWDLIDLVQIETPDSLREFGRVASQQQNISNARSVGLDFEAQTMLPLGIMARAGYSWVDAKDQATGRDLINAPRHHLRVSAGKDLARATQLGVGVRAESGRLTLYASRTDPSLVVDLSLTSRVLSDRVTLQASVKNLFDADYATPGGFQHLQSALPQPGRLATVRFGWNW
jgi:iron complex outermembrane receptor protein